MRLATPLCMTTGERWNDSNFSLKIHLLNTDNLLSELRIFDKSVLLILVAKSLTQPNTLYSI